MPHVFAHRGTLRTLLALAVIGLLGLIESRALAQDEDYEGEEISVADMEALAPPSTSAGKQVAWVMKVLNGEPLGEPSERFSDRFLEQFKVGELEKELKSVRSEGFKNTAIDIVRILNDDNDDSIEVIVRGVGTKRVLSLFLVTDEKNGKIAGLLFGPAGGYGDEEGDWDAYSGEMGDMKGSASFGAYELIAEDASSPTGPYRLVPVHEFGEEIRLAIGSTFKLWILGALAEEIVAGRLAWDQSQPVKESFKSLPSGTMHLEPAGTTHALSHFATQMISISDNTATDHLLHMLGREKVEAYMQRVHSAPQVNRPMLSTREMFTIKLAADRELLNRYSEADEESRRTMLAEGGEVYTSLPSLILAGAWKKPIGIQRVEWFAGPRDCCRVMADLRRLEQLPGMEPLGSALRKNPGMPQNPSVWKSVAFKGGSEPGVMNLTFLLERIDGRWFAFFAGTAATEKPLEEIKLIEMAQKGINMLAGFDRAEPEAAAPEAE